MSFLLPIGVPQSQHAICTGTNEQTEGSIGEEAGDGRSMRDEWKVTFDGLDAGGDVFASLNSIDFDQTRRFAQEQQPMIDRRAAGDLVLIIGRNEKVVPVLHLSQLPATNDAVRRVPFQSHHGVQRRWTRIRRGVRHQTRLLADRRSTNQLVGDLFVVHDQRRRRQTDDTRA